MIAENIAAIRENIRIAAEKSGRDPKDILLLAVTKTQPVPVIEEAMACGLTSLGENRVQELLDKYEVIGEKASWHLIGHLQTNKVRYILEKAALIHSVESLRLAEEINRRAEKIGRRMPVLVEVNIAKEPSKFGILPEDCESFLRQIATLPAIEVKGLMTVAPFVENPEENRVYFRKMKELLVDMNAKKIDNIAMDTLSMGMSGDYRVAVEEGATIVRVGTSIFGERTYPANNA